MFSASKIGLSVVAAVYNRVGDNPVIKNSIYETTFLAIMGPMKPVSDVLCTIYSSALIDKANQVRIEILIKRIYNEIQNATGIAIPNANDWITLLLSVCKGKTCNICEQKLKKLGDVLNTTGIEIDAETIKTKVNAKIADILTEISNLVGSATDKESYLSKLLAKYKEKVAEVKLELETAVKETFTVDAFTLCINTKIRTKGTGKCFTELTDTITKIQNEMQNDLELIEFYEKIKEIKNMLSPPQTPTLGGKTRRRRLMRSRRRGRSLRRRRHHQHSSQQRKHKNKREQH